MPAHYFGVRKTLQSNQLFCNITFNPLRYPMMGEVSLET